MESLSERTPVKLPLQTFLLVIAAVVSTTVSILMYVNNQNNNIKDFKTEIKSDIKEVKSTQDIMIIQQKNQYTELKNSIKRDSTDRSIGFKELKEEIKEQAKVTQSLLLRTSYSKGPISNN